MDKVLTSAVRLVNFIKDHKLPAGAAALILALAITGITVAAHDGNPPSSKADNLPSASVKSAQTVTPNSFASNPVTNPATTGTPTTGNNSQQVATNSTPTPKPSTTNIPTKTTPAPLTAPKPGTSTTSPTPKPSTPTPTPPSPTPQPTAPTFSLKLIPGTDQGGFDGTNFGFEFGIAASREAGYTATFQPPVARSAGQPGSVAPDCSVDPDKSFKGYISVPGSAPAGKYTCEFVLTDGTVTKTIAYSFTKPSN